VARDLFADYDHSDVFPIVSKAEQMGNFRFALNRNSEFAHLFSNPIVRFSG
jgi:hypothetical protein